MKKIALGVLLIAVVTVAAWAGSAHGTQTAQNYRTELNRICVALSARYDAIGAPKSVEELGTIGPQFLAAFRGALEAVKMLRPPSELEGSTDRFVALGEKVHDKLAGLVEAAKANDGVNLTRLGTQADALNKASDEIAKNQLGVPACADS